MYIYKENMNQDSYVSMVQIDNMMVEYQTLPGVDKRLMKNIQQFLIEFSYYLPSWNPPVPTLIETLLVPEAICIVGIYQLQSQ